MSRLDEIFSPKVSNKITLDYCLKLRFCTIVSSSEIFSGPDSCVE